MITAGQPSSNPRLVKEADALIEAGYEVTVIYQYFNDWATTLDKTLLEQKKWKHICIGGKPDWYLYWKTRIGQKIATSFTKYAGFYQCTALAAIGRCTPLLIKKACEIKADLYIAHNLGALPAAVKAAAVHRAKCGFDAEDFHRNEVSDHPKDFDVRLKTYVENRYIPQLDYLTTASPLISEVYQNLYPDIEPQTILNVFPKQNEVENSANGKPLKLFWFSQTIGKDRGLENIIKAIGSLPEFEIALHVLGNIDEATQSYFNELSAANSFRALSFYPPIPAEAIYAFAAGFDIGLATEIGTPKNRNLCLTNKIFTYIQAGMAVLASDTLAQKKLIEEFPEIGLIFEQNNQSNLIETISAFATNPQLVANCKKSAKVLATEQLNWELEKETFLTIVTNTINQN